MILLKYANSVNNIFLDVQYVTEAWEFGDPAGLPAGRQGCRRKSYSLPTLGRRYALCVFISGGRGSTKEYR